MKWRAEKLPAPRSSRGNMWDNMIPAELVRTMRGRPGTTFLLLDDDGNPSHIEDTSNQAAAGPYPCNTANKGRPCW